MIVSHYTVIPTTPEEPEINSNLLKSIYLLSFRKYEGFHDFDI